MNRRELAAAYLLDDLDDAGRADVERRLGDDTELRAEVEAMRPLLGRLGALPEGAWPEQDLHPVEHSGQSAPRRWSFRPAVAILALVVVTGLGVTLGAILGGGGGGRGQEPAIVLHPLAPQAGEQATVAMPAAGEMVFRAEGLPPLDRGQYYELWLMSSSERLVAVASFRVGADGSAELRVPLPADPTSYRYFDVSRQLLGAGTAHSADSVLRGKTT